MMYGSWDMECKGENFLSFWNVFRTFTHLATQKIKILKKWKKTCRYYHFTHVFHKWQSYDVWFLRYLAWQTISLLFWTIFPPKKTQKIKILKKWKNSPVNIIILHKCTKNHDHMLHCSWGMIEKKISGYVKSFDETKCIYIILTKDKQLLKKINIIEQKLISLWK